MRWNPVLISCILQVILYDFIYAINYEVINYENIDFTNMTQCKEAYDHNGHRVVFHDLQHQEFTKIWDQNYCLAEHFLDALNLNFYDLAPLTTVIFDSEGFCRGYQTKACLYNFYADEDFKINLEINSDGFARFCPIESQNIYFQTFYKNLLAKIKESGYFYFDFVPSNIVLLDEGYLIVDLESVYTLNQLILLYQSQLVPFESIVETFPLEYQKFIKESLNKFMENYEINK